MTRSKRISDILPMKSADLKMELLKLEQKGDEALTLLHSLNSRLDETNSTVRSSIKDQKEEDRRHTQEYTKTSAELNKLAGSIEAIDLHLQKLSNRLASLEKMANDLKTSRWEADKAELTSLASLHASHFFEHLDCHIVDHCNLNCASCSTFSPLANKRFASVDLVQSSLEKLHEIVGDKVIRLHLIGGEPLLHPHVIELGRIARTSFPHADIDFTTNGLLISKMDESFWEMMRKYSIKIKYTPYPIDFDYESMESYIRSKGVSVFSASSKPIKYFRRMPLDSRGVYSAHKSYSSCPYTDCVQLIDGKLYRCPASGLAHILNAKIKEKGMESFPISPLDYLDFQSVTNEDEIFAFLSQAIPFCRYCNTSYSNLPWKPSNGDPSEWIDSR